MRTPSQRLFLMWFLVVLAFIKHDLFIKSAQPLHFTRGYEWTPLFLLGLPVLLQWLQYAKTRKALLGPVLTLMTVGLYLSDNLLFLGSYFTHYRRTVGYYLSEDQREVLKYLSHLSRESPPVVSEDLSLSYLATVYTPVRVWYGHPYNTPYADQRKQEVTALFESGVLVDAWRESPPLVVKAARASTLAVRTNAWSRNMHTEPIFKTKTYTIFRVSAVQ
jgi:hypothetical protein